MHIAHYTSPHRHLSSYQVLSHYIYAPDKVYILNINQLWGRNSKGRQTRITGIVHCTSHHDHLSSHKFQVTALIYNRVMLRTGTY